MLLTRFDPFKELSTLEDRIYEAFSTDLKNNLFANFTPAVNTREGKFAYHIDVDLPGAKKEGKKKSSQEIRIK